MLILLHTAANERFVMLPFINSLTHLYKWFKKAGTYQERLSPILNTVFNFIINGHFHEYDQGISVLSCVLVRARANISSKITLKSNRYILMEDS